MKAQDWMSQDNNRAAVVNQLIALCSELGLSYKFTEKQFKITLPEVEELPVSSVATIKKRRTFDPSKWGPKGVDETALPTELPPTTTPLEEGEPPKGDDEK